LSNKNSSCCREKLPRDNGKCISLCILSFIWVHVCTFRFGKCEIKLL